MERKDIDKKYIWNLEDIYENIQNWEKAIDNLNNEINKVDNYKKNMILSSDNLYNFLNWYEDVCEQIDKIVEYASLKYCENTKNATYQAMYQKAMSEVTYISSKLSFVNSEIIKLQDSQIQDYYNQNLNLKKYKQFINDIMRMKSHTLNEDKENMLSKLSDFSMSPGNIFSSFNNSDLKFEDVLDSKNIKHKLTHGTYTKYLTSNDRVLRKNAFNNMYDAYYSYKNTLADIFLANVKKDIYFKDIRGYNSSLEYYLNQNNIDTKVYDNIVKVVNDNLIYLQEYLRLKKNYLKLDQMHMYDIYLNIANSKQKDIEFDSAKNIVIDALKVLGDGYISVLKKAFDNRWIDVYETDGKRSGGFTSQVYGVHPYVLLNYNKTLDDVSTIAHELGHAMHSHYTLQNQTYIYSNYCIFVAEIASTVNEYLLNDYLVKNTEDKDTKIYLLNDFLERFRATVYRQTMFAEFEKNVHQNMEESIPVTCDNLCDIYYKLNQKYFGKNIVIDKPIEMEWARIPHFYNSFYVYQYATGMSCAIYIANRILNNDSAIKIKYLDFLKSGDSKYPLDILNDIGINLDDTQVFKEAIDVFNQKLAQLKTLCGD